MADDIAPAIVQAASLMSGMTIASIRAKGVGFTMSDGHLERTDAYRVVGVEQGKVYPFYYVEDAINFLLHRGFSLLLPSDLDSWTRTLNSGKELRDMDVTYRGFDGNICVAVFGREAVAQIAAKMELDGRGSASTSPTAQLTASILAASATYNLPSSSAEPSPPIPRKHTLVTLSRLVAVTLDDSIFWAVLGLGGSGSSSSTPDAGKTLMRFDSHEDAFNYCVVSGCIPMEKLQEDRWKVLIDKARDLVGSDPEDDAHSWPYYVSGEVLNVFMRHA